jgi:hypothetical protein
MRHILFLLVFCSLFLECERKNNLVETAECINRKIDEILEEEAWNPPAKIYSFMYNGQMVYYVPPRCCDIPSTLYDENCNIICYPDGGFTGGGDGRCNDFFDSRTDEKLIWEDTRE